MRAVVGVPFIRSQAIEIFGIDDGILAPGQRDTPECIAVAYPAVGQHEPEQGFVQPGRNVQNNLNESLLRGKSR